MDRGLIRAVLDTLPVPELEESLTTFLTPMLEVLPDRRLQRGVPLAVRGSLAGETPVVTAMAQSSARTQCEPWPAAKRSYRLLENPRVPARLLTTGLYHRAHATVAQEQPSYLVVAVDPVTCEQPYPHVLEGVRTVRTSTPPSLAGTARLTRGYPASTATVVNTRLPATTYANWFSYQVDFRSEHWEIKRALRMTRAIFPHHRLRFVADSGLDDQKMFAWIAAVDGAFVIRASHLARSVEVANPRLQRWEREPRQDLVTTVPFATAWEVPFSHAGETRPAPVKVGWLHLQLPETQPEL